MYGPGKTTLTTDVFPEQIAAYQKAKEGKDKKALQDAAMALQDVLKNATKDEKAEALQELGLPKSAIDEIDKVDPQGALNRDTPLMDAAKHNFTATFEALCMLGATRKRSHYVTSLMLAAKKGHAEVVDILASFGAWLTFKDKQGNTALHYAAANNQLAVVQTLFAWSKVPMEWDSYGFLDPDYYKGFKYLLYNAWHPEKEHFGFLDHWNNDHNTALHLAAMYGATEAAITLVKDGASKDLKNNDGRSPLDLAVEKEENDKEKGEPSTGTAEALRKLGCRETYFKGLRDLARGKW